ncbi:uncharacterized protein AAGF69_003781 [Amazona ochrocephala]
MNSPNQHPFKSLNSPTLQSSMISTSTRLPFAVQPYRTKYMPATNFWPLASTASRRTDALVSRNMLSSVLRLYPSTANTGARTVSTRKHPHFTGSLSPAYTTYGTALSSPRDLCVTLTRAVHRRLPGLTPKRAPPRVGVAHRGRGRRRLRRAGRTYGYLPLEGRRRCLTSRRATDTTAASPRRARCTKLDSALAVSRRRLRARPRPRTNFCFPPSLSELRAPPSHSRPPVRLRNEAATERRRGAGRKDGRRLPDGIPDLLERARRQEGDGAAGGQTEGGVSEAAEEDKPITAPPPPAHRRKPGRRGQPPQLACGSAAHAQWVRGGSLTAVRAGRHVSRLRFCGMLKAEGRGSRGKLLGTIVFL